MSNVFPVSAQIAAGVDPQVHPGDDLFGFISGTWLKEEEIPAEEIGVSPFATLRLQSEQQCHQILLDLMEKTGSLAEASTDEERLTLLFRSFMDVERANELGVSPLAEDIAKIREAKTSEQVLLEIAALEPTGVSGPFRYGVDTDQNCPSRQIFELTQGGLGIPDESYYREEHHQKILSAYKEHVARMSKLLEVASPGEEAEFAERVLELESAFASVHLDVVSCRDSQKTNNPMTFAQLEEKAPAFNWRLWRKAIILPDDAENIIVFTPDTIVKQTEIIRDACVETVRAWAMWRVAKARIPYLNEEITEANFEFEQALTGLEKQKERWKRAVSLVESILGEALGRIYVARHFPPSHKDKMVYLVDKLLEAYRISISQIDWMSKETRAKALEKLSKFRPKIGYPENMRTYEGLVVRSDDLMGNVRRGMQYEQKRMLAKAGKPVDPDEWLMTPQTVNAYYHPARNEIVFPAAILQPPFFDPQADDAWNYGGIGGVIGHEIGHGFDDQGSLYDGDGKLESWWTEEDRERFEERTKSLIAQYNEYIPRRLLEREDKDALKVNGALTIGENIGDIGGIGIAELAYEIALKEKGQNFDTAEVIEGVTAIQRLYYSWGLIWRSKMRDEMAIQILSWDPHSPAEFRCNGVVRNLDSFYKAFDVKPGHLIYLPPEERVRIWC